MMETRDRRRVDTVEQLMKVIGAKWKPAILFCLVHGGRQRYSNIRRAIPDATQRMLTLRLRELERDGIVRRFVHQVVPPRVEYEMTELGMELHPIFRDLCSWGEVHQSDILACRKAYDRKNGRGGSN